MQTEKSENEVCAASATMKKKRNAKPKTGNKHNEVYIKNDVACAMRQWLKRI